LCPIPLQVVHRTTVPLLDRLPRDGFLFFSSCLFLSFFSLPGILTYFGVNGFSLSDIGHKALPSTGCKQCAYVLLYSSTK
jgi:hypothetical protein